MSIINVPEKWGKQIAMLTGQHPLDLGSRALLYWHVGKMFTGELE